jgi:hypothetical protein
MDKVFQRAQAALVSFNRFFVEDIKTALGNEELVKEFENKLAEYGSTIYEGYLKRREELSSTLQNESLKRGLEKLLNRIDKRIRCYGKEDIEPSLPVITLECVIGAQLEKSILDAVYNHIKAGDYSRVRKVISYLSSRGIYKKIVEAFSHIFLYELGGYIPDILEETRNIDKTIKKIDKAYQYASKYIREAIENLFYNKEEDFLNKIEYGIQLEKYYREK